MPDNATRRDFSVGAAKRAKTKMPLAGWIYGAVFVFKNASGEQASLSIFYLHITHDNRGSNGYLRAGSKLHIYNIYTTDTLRAKYLSKAQAVNLPTDYHTFTAFYSRPRIVLHCDLSIIDWHPNRRCRSP